MKKNMILTVVLVVSIFVVSSAVMAFDLTEFGFKPEYDFGGETVTIISWTSDRMNNYFNDYLPVLGRVAEAEELFNCKIEWLQTRDIPETNFNRLLAGESTYDLWHVQNKIGYWELVANDAVYPMGELLGDTYYSMLPPSLVAVEEALKFQDQYWGIGSVEWRPLYGYQNDMLFAVYNKTIIEREGLPDPYELFLAGEWTWEAATEIAIGATIDLDGDGVIDQWGIGDCRVWDLAISNGASMTKVDEDGRIVFTGDDPAYIEAWEQMYQWRTVLKVQNPSPSFNNGEVAIHFSRPAFELGTIINDLEDEWGLVPFPMGPSADKHYWTVQALNTTVVPINAKDPEGLAALRAFLWREEDVMLSDFLAAHTNRPESAEVLLLANNEWAGQASRLFQDLVPEFETYHQEIYNGDRSASVTMAEIKPIIQGRLDDLFNQ